MNPIATVATSYHAAGLAVLPARLPDKRPAIGAWKNYQSRLPTAAEVEAWFANDHDSCCLICGAVSGNLELIDFDCAGEAFAAWSHLVTSEAPGLLDRLVIETSPSGGWHVVYRSEELVDGNLKLAQRREDVDGPLEVERHGKRLKPRKDKQGRWHILLTMIETRGEGGLFLCAPTPGYELVQGGFGDLPILTADERDVLLRCARALHEVMPDPVAGRLTSITRQSPCQNFRDAEELRPGDLFAGHGDLPSLLEHHGWSLVRDGENQHWCRPGKTGSTSATLRDGVLYVFSSNATPFEPEQAYSPFAVYAHLEHGGDFQAAATELRRLGFGEERPTVGDDVDLSGLLAAEPQRPVSTFDLQTFADTPERQIDWLWPGVIPRGMLSLIAGKQGLGKSFLICDLAARISAGRAMPDGSCREPGKVLLLAREDDASCVLLPRLRAAGADLGRVMWSVFAHAETQSPLDLASHIDLLIGATEEHSIELIVVDTFAAFASAGADANAAQDVRMLLDSLTRLARTTGAAVVVVAHLRKAGRGDGDPMDTIAGSVQMSAGVRVASILSEGIAPGERWFRVVKSNLGRIDEHGWTWRFAWPDPFTEGAADMPHLVWSLGTEEHRSPGSGQATIDIAAVKEYLTLLIDKAPRSLRSAVDLVARQLRAAGKPAGKADVEIAIEGLAESSEIDKWEGPRGGVMIGPMGGREQDDPAVRARRVAMEHPGMSVRALRDMVGCRREVAAEALRVARGHVSTTSMEDDEEGKERYV